MKTEALIYDSAHTRPAMLEEAAALLAYRDLLVGLVRRDLTVRYKRSALGFFWTMLNPLLTMLVLTIVFSAFFRFAIEHYAVYLLSGLLLWNFFQQSTAQAMQTLVWGGDLVSKIYLPKSIFVVSATLVNLINMLLALAPLLLMMLVTGPPFSPALLFLPIPIFLTFLFTLGAGLIFSTLAVFFEDMIDIHRIGTMVLMYLTPLFYPIEVVPSQYLVFVRLNPMYYFVELFRRPVYAGQLPDLSLLIITASIAVGVFVVGWWFFAGKADEFAYRT